MSYRAFIRFSLDGDNGALTTCLSNLLTGNGFTKVGTGEYQIENQTSQQVAGALRAFWKALEDPQLAFPGVSIPGATRVDHVWAYSGTH